MPFSTIFATLLCAVALGAPFTVRDNIKIHRLGNPVLGHDGDIFVYTKTKYHDGKNSADREIIFSMLSKPTMNVKVCPDFCSSMANPTWYADSGVLLFTCPNASGVNQIASWDQRTCRFVTDFQTDVNDFKVSPDGSFIVFSAEVFFGMDLEESAAHQAKIDAAPAKYRLYKDPYIRHWDTWITPDKWIHLFAGRAEFDPATSIVQVSHVYDVMKKLDGDAPLRPFGDTSQYDISSRNVLAFVTQLGVERAWKTNDHIYTVQLTTQTTKPEPFCFTKAHYPFPEARSQTPSWSSDGKTMYFLGQKMAGAESDRMRIWRWNSESLTLENLTEEYDIAVGEYMLHPNSQRVIYVTATHHAATKLFVLDLEARFFEPITKRGSVSGATMITKGRYAGSFIFGYSTYESPHNIYLGTHGGSLDPLNLMPLTTWNNEILSKFVFAPLKEVWLDAADGSRVHSWYFLPTGYRGPRDGVPLPPLIMYTHGGPESPWTDAWSYRWNPQIYATAGYAMILTNYHGSDSFGTPFRESIRDNWFGAPFEDLKQGVAWMLSQGYGDPNRVGAMGASFGANLMNWLQGHNDIDAKVIICHNGVFDTRHNALETEEMHFPDYEMFGPVFDPKYRPNYEEWNPRNHIHKWRTPMLVIHGAYDFRISYSHGISAHQALIRQGIKSQFLWFPTQSHWVYSPQESCVWHDNVLRWLGEYLAPVPY